MRCYMVTPETKRRDEAFPFNSRAFCVAPDVCAGPARLYGAQREGGATCSAVGPSLDTAVARPLNCSWLVDQVRCAHGTFLRPTAARCPRSESLREARGVPPKAWAPDIVVIVPAYPHLRNIFHYAHALGAATHVAAALPVLLRQSPNQAPASPHGKMPSVAAFLWQQWGWPRRRRHVTLLFRGPHPQALGGWQAFTLRAMQARLKGLGIDTSVRAFGQSVKMHAKRVGPALELELELEQELGLDTEMKAETAAAAAVAGKENVVCGRTTVLLGLRGDVNVWPFATGANVMLKETHEAGSSVPAEAVAWRAATYAAAGIRTVLPTAGGAGVATGWSDLPPLSIGYARRGVVSDPRPGEPIPIGQARRVSRADDAWLTAMLRTEATRNGMSFATLETPEDFPPARQVRLYRAAGVVVGLHGANLLNAIFAPPFAALVEIANGNMLCYKAAANSGLASWTFIPSRIASPREAACAPADVRCNIDVVHRRVLLHLPADRARLRGAVRTAIAHVLRVRRAFAHLGAVPIRYHHPSASYRIDWSRAARTSASTTTSTNEIPPMYNHSIS